MLMGLGSVLGLMLGIPDDLAMSLAGSGMVTVFASLPPEQESYVGVADVVGESDPA
jgi:hypothetical protein